ncbi:VOC family protein [Streptomyces sp. NPDC001139]
MPKARVYPPGTPVWWELVTDDPPKTAAFYQRLFAWQVQAPVSGYQFCLREERPIAAIVGRAHHCDTAGPGWLPSLFVAALDEACERVGQHGGAVLVPPTPVDGKGRQALVRDPGGAVCSLWAATHLPDPAPLRGEGQVWKSELLADDPRGSAAFYAAVLGCRAAPNDRERGAIRMLVSPESLALFDVRPRPSGLRTGHWMPGFVVKNLTRAVQAVRNSGGENISEGTTEMTATLIDPHLIPFSLTALGSLPSRSSAL